MSDPTTEPGAPSAGATNIPSASEKSIANQAKEKMPPKVLDLARVPDRIILRLNKCVSDHPAKYSSDPKQEDEC